MDIWTNSPKARSASNEALKTLMTTTTITYPPTRSSDA